MLLTGIDMMGYKLHVVVIQLAFLLISPPPPPTFLGTGNRHG